MINSDGTPAIRGLSPGKRLLQGRLQSGLTQEQVAKELYITQAKIKALESDSFGGSNTDTFIRGYIRSYANLLKLDVVEILAAYDELVQETEQRKQLNTGVKLESAATFNPNVNLGQFLIVIVIFFVGLWLVSVWFLDNHPEKKYMQSAGAFSAASVTAAKLSKTLKRVDSLDGVDDNRVLQQVPKEFGAHSVAKSTGVTSSASSKSPESSLSLLPVSEQIHKASSLSEQKNISSIKAIELSSVAKVKAESTVKQNSLDAISFSFRAESWLEVSDSRGDVLATELQAAGSALTLVGKAPFDVKLGNAPAVDIRFNDKKIDVIPLLGSNVLTVKVGD